MNFKNYDLVKEVNNKGIYRAPGSRLPYFVPIRWNEQTQTGSCYEFKTCKAAVQFLSKQGA